MRCILAISLTLLLTVACASNPPAFKTGLSKSQPREKYSVKDPLKKKPAKSRIYANRQPIKLASIAPRSSTRKNLLPTVTNKKDGSLMVLVPADTQHASRLNLPRGILRPATPASLAKIVPTFYMDRLETTVAQYKKFNDRYDEKPFTDGKECPQCPAMGIDWFNAHRYCLWAEKRLPTEAQWMASTGGVLGNSWPWGKKFSPEKANLWGDTDGALAVAQVGSYPQGASPYGVMDTVGNVWEWTRDSYLVPTNKSKKIRLRIVKGGGWTSDKKEARISFRNIVDPKIKNPTIGFRCAKSIVKGMVGTTDKYR